MTAKAARDLMRAWCSAVVAAPFYDTVNLAVDPSEDVWFSVEFFSQEHEGNVFCTPGYIERGTIDVVWNARPGQGDGPLLTAMESGMQEILANRDASNGFVIESYEPIDEQSDGSADSHYRMVMSLNYAYHA